MHDSFSAFKGLCYDIATVFVAVTAAFVRIFLLSRFALYHND